MQKYIVTGIKAVIPSGTVMILNAEQAAARKPYLKSVGKDKYQVISPTEFKRGEEIGIVGAIKNKALDGNLEKSTTDEKKDNAPH
jgi:hypothetical protein